MIPKPLRTPRPRKPIQRRSRPSKVRKTSRGKMTREADRLFSLIVRKGSVCYGGLRGRKCAGPLQCAHVVSRSYRSTRWADDGAISLCAGCHRYFTSRPVEWRGFLIEWFGREWLEGIEQRALKVWDKDLEGVLARLKARAKELGIE